MNIYYTYAYLDNAGAPYYIGKGKGNRAYDRHDNVVTPSKDNIVILQDGLSEAAALELEEQYIEGYGRICDGGILFNSALKGSRSFADDFMPEPDFFILDEDSMTKQDLDTYDKWYWIYCDKLFFTQGYSEVDGYGYKVYLALQKLRSAKRVLYKLRQRYATA